ncbi:hypothetical protein LguiA_021879 [Lonicera macranthoides]
MVEFTTRSVEFDNEKTVFYRSNSLPCCLQRLAKHESEEEMDNLDHYYFSDCKLWLGALTIQPWMQRDSTSELGFGILSRAFISSVKGYSRKDGIRRCVSRTDKIRVEKGELVELDEIGMGIGTCIDVPNRLMLPG